MSFLQQLQELFELMPDYATPPDKKPNINPFEAVLVAHVISGLNSLGDVKAAANEIEADYKHIDQKKLAKILQDNHLPFRSNHPNALYNLFNNLGKIVRKVT